MVILDQSTSPIVSTKKIRPMALNKDIFVHWYSKLSVCIADEFRGSQLFSNLPVGIVGLTKSPGWVRFGPNFIPTANVFSI